MDRLPSQRSLVGEVSSQEGNHRGSQASGITRLEHYFYVPEFKAPSINRSPPLSRYRRRLFNKLPFTVNNLDHGQATFIQTIMVSR